MNPKNSFALSLFLLLLALLSSCRSDRAAGGEGQALNIRITADPDVLDPLITTSAVSLQICSQIYYPLLDFHPENMSTVPVVAAKLPEVRSLDEGPYAGGQEIEFRIRPEAVWDDGSPVTAADYLFTLKSILNPLANTNALRAYLGFIDSVATDPADARHFSIFSKERYILSDIVAGNLLLIQEKAWDPRGLLSQFNIKQLKSIQPADSASAALAPLRALADSLHSPALTRLPGRITGCGPYRLKSWNAGSSVILERKPDWWGKGLDPDNPYLQAHPSELHYRLVPDVNAAVSMALDGSLDVLSEIPVPRYKELMANAQVKQLFDFHQPTSMNYLYVGINNKQPRLADRRVRRALAGLCDVQQMLATVMQGMGTPLLTPFHPQKPYYARQLKPIPFDIKQAGALLREAGWQDSDNNGILDKNIGGRKTELSLDLLYSTKTNQGEQVGTIFRDAAARAGIRINLVGKDPNALKEDLSARKFDLFVMASSTLPTLDDPQQLWHTSSDTPDGSNRCGFGNAASDALIDSIQVCLDPDRRNDLYARFQQMIYDEQPVIFLFTGTERVMTRKSFIPVLSSRKPGYVESAFRPAP